MVSGTACNSPAAAWCSTLIVDAIFLASAIVNCKPAAIDFLLHASSKTEITKAGRKDRQEGPSPDQNGPQIAVRSRVEAGAQANHCKSRLQSLGPRARPGHPARARPAVPQRYLRFAPSKRLGVAGSHHPLRAMHGRNRQ